MLTLLIWPPPSVGLEQACLTKAELCMQKGPVLAAAGGASSCKSTGADLSSAWPAPAAPTNVTGPAPVFTLGVHAICEGCSCSDWVMLCLYAAVSLQAAAAHWIALLLANTVSLCVEDLVPFAVCRQLLRLWTALLQDHAVLGLQPSGVHASYRPRLVAVPSLSVVQRVQRYLAHAWPVVLDATSAVVAASSDAQGGQRTSDTQQT